MYSKSGISFPFLSLSDFFSSTHIYVEKKVTKKYICDRKEFHCQVIQIFFYLKKLTVHIFFYYSYLLNFSLFVLMHKSKDNNTFTLTRYSIWKKFILLWSPLKGHKHWKTQKIRKSIYPGKIMKFNFPFNQNTFEKIEILIKILIG